MAEKAELFGDDFDEWSQLLDPDKDGRPGITTNPKKLKFINQIPKECRKIPAPEIEQDIIKTITGYGIWYLVNYGSHLIELVCKPCALIFSQVVKFKTGFSQKRIPFLEGKG